MAYWQDDTFDTWPEVYRAGTAAVGLYSRCGAYCARELTDGHIPAELVASYGTREWAQKLVEVGLWEIEETGVRDVYFLYGKKGNKLNPTREEALKKLRGAAERTAKWREKTAVTRHQRKSDASRDTVRDASSDGVPSLPPSKEGKGESAPASPGGALSPLDVRPTSSIADVDNPDWRHGRAAGVAPDPDELHRRHRGAAIARAAIGSAPKARSRPGPVEVARQRGSSLDSLDAAVAGLPPLAEPANDPPEERLALVIPIRPEET